MRVAVRQDLAYPHCGGPLGPCCIPSSRAGKDVYTGAGHVVYLEARGRACPVHGGEGHVYTERQSMCLQRGTACYICMLYRRARHVMYTCYT